MQHGRRLPRRTRKRAGRIGWRMEQKDAILLLVLFAAAENRELRDTLSSALAFYLENRDVLCMLFAPQNKKQPGGAQEAPPEQNVEYSHTEQKEQAADPALISALLKFRSRG